MQKRDPDLVISGYSGLVTQDGVTVRVNIVRLEGETDWTLEVVNSAGTSTVWDGVFLSDDDAIAEFRRTLAEEGMRAFVEGENVVPFRR